MKKVERARVQNVKSRGEVFQHYFAREPGAPSRQREVRATLRGATYRFVTDHGVFSFAGIDAGTRLLIETLEMVPNAHVVDLGCGYGAIGIAAAQLVPQGFVILTDINARAAQLAQENLRRHQILNAAVVQADGLSPFRQGVFDVVVCNPPLRAGNATVYRLINESRERLKPQGQLWLVAQTKQGAKTLLRRVTEIFGWAEERALKGGYRVIRAVRLR
ncbi:MAG: class I SAM-dependent methyltransferase [Abditibacteriales bacterium]|nr:class I SAM-dependent methyltransferase [Abditibacteriales bacterium]MDW8368456.1 class I SAM-dependent methyltransferase [Abditibacteriales bacterium]